MDSIKIGTLNVRGLKNKIKRRALIKLFQNKQFNILACQETYLDEKVLK